VALVLAWPLLNRFVLRRFLSKVEIPVLAEAVHSVEDAHHHSQPAPRKEMRVGNSTDWPEKPSGPG